MKIESRRGPAKPGASAAEVGQDAQSTSIASHLDYRLGRGGNHCLPRHERGGRTDDRLPGRSEAFSEIGHSSGRETTPAGDGASR